jgi:hypothetical protein
MLYRELLTPLTVGKLGVDVDLHGHLSSDWDSDSNSSRRAHEILRISGSRRVFGTTDMYGTDKYSPPGRE